jgi:zinc protease
LPETRDPLVLEEETLASGLRVVHQPPPPAAHSVSFSFVAPAGWGYDRPREAGAAMFTSGLLTSGAGKLGRIALAQKLDRLGATLGTDADPESAEVTLWGPASVARELLRLLADVVLRPRFAASDAARVRRQLLERQLRQETQPDGRAERVLLEALYPSGHPYRSPEGLGTRSTLAALTVPGLRRFQAEHYQVRDGLLVATTREPLASVVRQANTLFAPADRRSPPLPDVPAPGRVPKGIRRLAMPGRSQVEIRVGSRSVTRGDPGFPAAFLANEILGGRSMLHRLFQRVRERHGLAYHASSSLEAMRWGGYFYAEAGTNPKAAERTLRLVEHEVELLRTERVGASELDRIRESTIGSIPLSVETTSGAHQVALDVAYHRLPLDHYRRWPAILRAVRAREIREAAERAFDMPRAVRILAGPLPTGHSSDEMHAHPYA